MLENTDIWSKGSMNLWVNNEPRKVYITPESVRNTYEDLQARLTDDGSIPIGIDHLPEAVIKANPVLEKLDLLNVGTITAVDYNADNDSIMIKEATLTNPLLKQLYYDNELEGVSIVAPATVKTCPHDKDVLIVDKTTIDRVDIVGEGACPTCKIPKPSETDVIYARKPISEVDTMAEDQKLTKEDIKSVFEEAVGERFDKIEARLAALEEDKKPEKGDEGTDVDLEAKEALFEAQKDAAGALVDVQIMAGKVTPAQKENMVKLALADRESFIEMMKDAPVIVDLEARRSLLGIEEDEEEDETLSDGEKAIEQINAYFNKE